MMTAYIMLCNHVSAYNDSLCYWMSKTQGVMQIKEVQVPKMALEIKL